MNLRRAIIIGIGCIAMAGVPACGEDPAGTGGTLAYADEGSIETPLDITGMVPYNGQVSKDGRSYYRITGVTPDAIYTITLIRSDGLAYQSVPNAGGAGSVECGWDNITPGATIDCAMVASAGGMLDFSVFGDDTVGGTYILNFSDGGAVNEGSPSDPVIVSSFPFSGTALHQSYYLLTGLSPGGAYKIEFIVASDPATLFIFPDDTYMMQPTLCHSVYGSGNPCNVTADGSGQIYLTTGAGDILGITYTIAVNPADLANEGSDTFPVNITALLPYSGMVHIHSSWYIINGLTPGSPYTITLSNATDNVGLYVYGPGWFEPLRRADSQVLWINGGGNPIACVSIADSNGDIRIEVRGGDTADGATFDLENVAGGIPNEGYPGNPVDLTGVTPWEGTVYNGPSFYRITGRSAGTDYTVTISDLTDNLTLWVYDDDAYQNMICYSSQLGTADETCVVQTATGEFYIRVTTGFYVFGATFTLDVAP